LALEWGPHGIRVNGIAPGYIDTPMSAWMHADPVQKELLLGRTPIGRLGEPEDIARAVVYLAGEDASFVTGQVLLVDGGITKA
jgi:NAD(P)-dependent dehydrogenase (short-subunit alcohol dehydrogenase family)